MRELVFLLLYLTRTLQDYLWSSISFLKVADFYSEKFAKRKTLPKITFKFSESNEISIYLSHVISYSVCRGYYYPR